MVLFPHKEMYPDLPNVLLTAHVEETLNGDLIDLNTFLNWIRLFHRTITQRQRSIKQISEEPEQSSQLPITLLVASSMYKLMFKSKISCVASSEIKKELEEFCVDKKIFILFVPDGLNENLFLSFKDIVNHTLKKWPNKHRSSEKEFLVFMKNAIQLFH